MIESLKNIISLEHPYLEPYRTLKRPLNHLKNGIFVAEGEKVTLRLLASNVRVYSILLSHDWFEQYKPILEKHQDQIDVFVGEKSLLENIVGHDLHQSVMAVGKVPKPISVPELSAKIQHAENHFSVLIDGIVNAENMGVIIRNCACFGIDTVILSTSSCDPYLRRSVRNSMGNIFSMELCYFQNNTKDIRMLQSAGMKFIGAHPNEQSKDISEIQFSKKTSIVVGSEGPGISKDVLSMCNEFAMIPMKEGVDSLNVASASAVLLWEMRKTMNNYE